MGKFEPHLVPTGRERKSRFRQTQRTQMDRARHGHNVSPLERLAFRDVALEDMSREGARTSTVSLTWPRS